MVLEYFQLNLLVRQARALARSIDNLALAVFANEFLSYECNNTTLLYRVQLKRFALKIFRTRSVVRYAML